MEPLLNFLSEQNIFQVAPQNGGAWIANVYTVTKDANSIYFTGNEERRYIKMLLSDPRLAFATAWNDPNDHLNRKGIQGIGRATKVTDKDEIETGVFLHNQKYPEFKNEITTTNIESNSNKTYLWVIKPTYIKYWDVEFYGKKLFEEFEIKY